MLCLMTLPSRKPKAYKRPKPRRWQRANESEAANRNAQLAKDELERLRTERIALNTALERSETERTAAEGKAHTMESVAYGTIIILIGLLAIASWLLLANRRKARAANHEAVGAETSRHKSLNPPRNRTRGRRCFGTLAYQRHGFVARARSIIRVGCGYSGTSRG